MEKVSTLKIFFLLELTEDKRVRTCTRGSEFLEKLARAG